MLFLDVNENKMYNAEILQEMIDNKKNVFVLVYLIGCNPCKKTLPEWNKLEGFKELEQYEHNDDIVVVNVEQSMCKNMHHKDLENIRSFPTIKHIQHNDVHVYDNERNTSAFAKWIKSLIKDDVKLRDLNNLAINKQDNTNHGNIDILFKTKSTKRRNVKMKMRSRTKRRKPKRNKKSKSIKKTRKNKKKKKTRKRNKKRNIRKMNRTSESRRLFQKHLN